jgi:hypothetical protein
MPESTKLSVSVLATPSGVSGVLLPRIEPAASAIILVRFCWTSSVTPASCCCLIWRSRIWPASSGTANEPLGSCERPDSALDQSTSPVLGSVADVTARPSAMRLSTCCPSSRLFSTPWLSCVAWVATESGSNFGAWVLEAME